MSRATTIDATVSVMEDIQARLDDAGDGRRHWHGVYRRCTIAMRDEIRRGGFLDATWLERWDVAFANLYLDAMDQWDRGETPPGPWQVVFDAARDPAIPPLRHIMLGLDVHINFDLPRALIGVVTDEEFDDPRIMDRKFADYQHVNDVLMVRAHCEDLEAAAVEPTGEHGLANWLLVHVDRAGSKRFLTESRRKAFANTRELSVARRQGPEVLAHRMAELEELCRNRVTDLCAPGQILLKLATHGFGVVLPG